ncbi:MAG TPA: 50S ribosomal protein L10 [Aggregatilineales bacterium]|nr:50S ribosomal protein L10 [Aggregatilineales bacterium]
MAITRAQKGEILQNYVQMLEKAQGLIITEYRGMAMNNFNTVRKAMRTVEGRYTVTKNTLLKLALRETGFAVPEDLLIGPVSIAIAYSDLTKLTKTMLDAARTDEKLVLKGGIMGSIVFRGTNGLEVLSTLPTLEHARASLIGTLQQPEVRLVSVLNQPGQGLAAILKAYTDKQSEGTAA